MFGNVNIFIKIVDSIVDAFKQTGLTFEQVKIVCSDNRNPGYGKISNRKKIEKSWVKTTE